MSLSRIMREDTYLLDCIGDVWPGEGKILKCTCKASVSCRIVDTKFGVAV